ncbi:hypothetical protein NKH47_01735 [Mesorhizobium sp. M1060]|uniref:hypothetical protein n=1 Tax=Mesorhizobium sp. M1060 TaxID=2957052 RepID=UPI00333BE656
MNNDYDALFSVVSLAGIVAIFYGPWQKLCADYCRQIIFEQREKLFDLAADGKLEFDSGEYRLLRSFLEKTIRFSHELTVYRFILHQVSLRYDSDRGPSVGDVLMAIEDRDTRKEATMIIKKSSRALVTSMGARSLLVLAFVAIVLPIRQLGGLTGLSIKMRRVERAVQHEVEHAT